MRTFVSPSKKACHSDFSSLVGAMDLCPLSGFHLREQRSDERLDPGTPGSRQHASEIGLESVRLAPLGPFMHCRRQSTTPTLSMCRSLDVGYRPSGLPATAKFRISGCKVRCAVARTAA